MYLVTDEEEWRKELKKYEEEERTLVYFEERGKKKVEEKLKLFSSLPFLLLSLSCPLSSFSPLLTYSPFHLSFLPYFFLSVHLSFLCLLSLFSFLSIYLCLLFLNDVLHSLFHSISVFLHSVYNEWEVRKKRKVWQHFNCEREIGDKGSRKRNYTNILKKTKERVGKEHAKDKKKESGRWTVNEAKVEEK